MKILIPIALFFLSALVLGQIDLKTGDQIKAGKLTLTNGEIIPFYSLEYGADEKISYVNTENLQTEFLYVNSIKSIETNDISAGEISRIKKELNDIQEVKTFSTFSNDGETIQLENPIKGKSVVYFVRTGGSGTMVNFRYFNGDKFIGKFAGRGFIRYECEPGDQVFWAASENSYFVKSSLKADKIYVIEVHSAMGIAYAQVKLEVVDRLNTKKYDKQKKRVMNILTKSEFDKSNSPNVVYATQSDYKKEIENGLSKYEKRLEKDYVLILHSEQYFE